MPLQPPIVKKIQKDHCTPMIERSREAVKKVRQAVTRK
jgi:hypothetical protein